MFRVLQSCFARRDLVALFSWHFVPSISRYVEHTGNLKRPIRNVRKIRLPQRESYEKIKFVYQYYFVSYGIRGLFYGLACSIELSMRLGSRQSTKKCGRLFYAIVNEQLLSLFSSHRKNWFAARCEYLHLIKKNSQRANRHCECSPKFPRVPFTRVGPFDLTWITDLKNRIERLLLGNWSQRRPPEE